MSLLIWGVSCNLLPGDTRRGHLHHHHPGDHREVLDEHSDHQQDAREGRTSDLLIDFSAAVDDAESGLKCVIKAAILETVEKESLLTCTHSLVPVCHYTYATQYRPSREEECGEYYHKTCRIVFSTQAVTETVRHCHRPVERQCGAGAQHRETVRHCHRPVERQCVTATTLWRDSAGQGHSTGRQLATTPPAGTCWRQSAPPGTSQQDPQVVKRNTWDSQVAGEYPSPCAGMLTVSMWRVLRSALMR